MRFCLIFILVAILSFSDLSSRCLARDPDGRGLSFSCTGKKFIELGWDIPDTAFLKEHHEEMQRTTPFDGVMLALETTAPDGKRYSSQSIMDPQAWDPAWFKRAVADLESCRWTTFTDNFIRLNFSPGRIRWNDEGGWKAFCDKSALCARIARQTGLKGLSIDFEPYGNAIFKYDPESGRSFPEMQRLVRQRGREWMKAIVSEYPDMVLFTLFILDFVPKTFEPGEIDVMLETAHYGLLPAFFNGMLDEVPPEIKIVDGCETGYYLNGIDEFSRRALAIQSIGGPAIQAVAPENRSKYVNQVQVGFGFYLDMYTNPEGNRYYRGPKEGGTRLDRLEENLTAARETADEYVWIYGEQRRWWKPADPEKEWEHWEKALPGMTETIRLVKNPVQGAEAILRQRRDAGTLENLLSNPDFSKSKPGKGLVGESLSDIAVPADWSTWQHEPVGTFSWDETEGDGSAKASKVEWGCLMQTRSVKPGEYYFVSMDARKRGDTQTGVRIRWQDAEKKWIRESDDRQFHFQAENRSDVCGNPLKEGWSRATGVVRIPEGVGFLVFQAGIRNQKTENDAVWFDNAVLLKVE